MAKPNIGHLACPACGEDADVREQKNGRAYLLCNSAICGFQGFARSADADKSLRARMKQINPATVAAPGAGTVQPPTTETLPKKKGFFDDLL